MKQMLAKLVAASWRGVAAAAKLGQETAEKVGKRLHKQVEKVQRLLADASLRATRARSALAKASLEDGLGALADRQAAVDERENEDHADVRRARYKGFTELDNEADAAVQEAAADATADAAADAAADARAERSIEVYDVLHRTTSPWAAWMESYEEERTAAAHEKEDDMADQAAFQLTQGGGIPRALARELGDDGCATVLKHLKANGGVGLAPHPSMIGAYCMRGHGGRVSVTWEEALRHDLPFMFGEEATRTRAMEETMKEGHAARQLRN